jgi:hypothetical protein
LRWEGQREITVSKAIHQLATSINWLAHSERSGELMADQGIKLPSGE